MPTSNQHIQAAINNANAAASAVTGYAGAMLPVPEIDNDPQAARKLAIATFHLADAVKELAAAIRN